MPRHHRVISCWPLILAVGGLLFVLGVASCAGGPPSAVTPSPSAPTATPVPTPTPTPVPTPTPRPPLVLRLNWIKVGEAEDFAGVNRAELYGFYVVSDKQTTEPGRFPRASHYGSYVNGTKQNVSLILFESRQVGPILKLYMAVWEQDGDCLEGRLVEALEPGIALLAGADLTLGIVASLVAQVVNEARASGCTTDDFLGEYEEIWFESEGWGEGTHEVISTNGNITFNFTIRRR